MYFVGHTGHRKCFVHFYGIVSVNLNPLCRANVRFARWNCHPTDKVGRLMLMRPCDHHLKCIKFVFYKTLNHDGTLSEIRKEKKR